MIKQVIAFVALLMAAQVTLADDPSEKGVPTSPLSVYSGGIGIGALKAINDELKTEQPQFLKISFLNSVYLSDNVSAFADVDWFGMGNNFGVDFGFDFIPLRGEFRPFIGGGVGVHYFDKAGNSFGENIGPSGTVHVGFLVDISDNVQVKARVPFHVVGNESMDYGMGIDVGFMFSSKLRNIKKLNYDKM